MTEATQAPPQAVASRRASAYPAVARCCKAHARALKAARRKGKAQILASIDAGRAYSKAMPPLSGQENIIDFIACVAHGMNIDAISGADGARLLYAAQVAHTTIRSMLLPPKSAAA